MELRAKKRKITGRRKLSSLRKKGLLPAVVYGRNFPATPLAVDLKDFKSAFKEAGETELLDLIVNKEKPTKVLIKDLQKDPLTDEVIHADFHKVELTEKVSATIPLEITGESPAVKSGEGVLLKLLDELEVEALPLNLPKRITVAISHLEKVGQGVTVAELPIDRSKVGVQHPADELVVKIDYLEMVKEEEEKTAPEEVEITTEKKTEEEVGTEEKPPATPSATER